MKKLRRSTNDKMFLGVLGGFGEYFNIDSNLLRILFAILLFSSSNNFFIIYIIFGIIMPKDKDEVIYQEESTYQDNSHLFIGLFFIIIGSILMIRYNFPGLLAPISYLLNNIKIVLRQFWPVTFIVLGIYILIN